MNNGSSRFTVVVLDDYANVAESIADWSLIGEDLELVVIREPLVDDDAVVKALRDADAVVAMRERTPLPRAVLDRLPRLALIVTTGARNASIDPGEHIVFSGTRSLTSPTVELTWALMLAARRHLDDELPRLRRGEWQHTLGEALEGTTLGIIGLGNIGRRIARVAHAFDMRVIAWSANLTHEDAQREGAELLPLDELCSESDIVSVHTRLSDRTRGLVGVQQLAALGPRGLLVNTSRAEIVDQEALVASLHDGVLGGAALDVFSHEPIKADDPILAAPRTVLSPHLGYVVRQNFELFYSDAVDAIVAFRSGSPIRTISAH